MRALKLLVLGAVLFAAVAGVGACCNQWAADRALASAADSDDLAHTEKQLQRGQASQTAKAGAIWAAVRGGREPMVKLLMGYGAPLNRREGANGWSLLEQAVFASDVRMVKLFAEHGVRCRAGNPPIAFAAGHQNIPIVAYFIRRGEDVNAADSAGETPLAYAVFEDNVALVRLLLRHGARVDVRDCTGHTMFALAKQQGDASLARELRSKGSPE